MDLSILPKIAALLIPLAGIALPVLIVFIVLHFRERQRQQQYDTVKHLADRGLPVPRELLDPPAKEDKSGTPRYRAFTLIGVGVGLAVMFAMLGLKNLMGIGALLVCIGLAQLFALQTEENDDEKAQRSPAPGPAPDDR